MIVNCLHRFRFVRSLSCYYCVLVPVSLSQSIGIRFGIFDVMISTSWHCFHLLCFMFVPAHWYTIWDIWFPHFGTAFIYYDSCLSQPVGIRFGIFDVMISTFWHCLHLLCFMFVPAHGYTIWDF